MTVSGFSVVPDEVTDFGVVVAGCGRGNPISVRNPVTSITTIEEKVECVLILFTWDNYQNKIRHKAKN